MSACKCIKLQPRYEHGPGGDVRGGAGPQGQGRKGRVRGPRGDPDRRPRGGSVAAEGRVEAGRSLLPKGGGAAARHAPGRREDGRSFA